MKIRTEHVYPPIPSRTSDWCAYDEDSYDGAEDAGPQLVGWGPTEEIALEDLRDQIMERECERDMKRALAMGKVWDSLFEQLLGKQS